MPAFWQADVHLHLHRVDALERREQDPATGPGLHDDPVVLRIEILGRARLTGAQDVHGARERLALVGRHRREPRVAHGRRVRVAGDLPAQGALGRLEGADAAAELTVLLEGDEAGRPPFVERVHGRLRRAAAADVAEDASQGVVGGTLGGVGRVAHPAVSAATGRGPNRATR